MRIVFGHSQQSHEKIRYSRRKGTIDGKDNKNNEKLKI